MPLEQDSFDTMSNAPIYGGSLKLLDTSGLCRPRLLRNEYVLELIQENGGNINSNNTQSNNASANANNSTTSNTTADSSSTSSSLLLVMLVDMVIH